MNGHCRGATLDNVGYLHALSSHVDDADIGCAVSAVAQQQV